MTGKSPCISTVHSFAAMVLRDFPPRGFTRNFTILDEKEQFITVSNLAKLYQVDQHPRAILEKLTLARNLRERQILQLVYY